jgi:thiopeptide-type bacteriocin biosynthesis protein
MFEHRDIALIRAPAMPDGLPGSWPDLLSHGPAAARQRQEWIRQTWAVPELADAIEAASPDLAARLTEICAGVPVTVRQQQRAAISLAKYLLRMQHRPTPFGLLAGIAPARITDCLVVRDDVRMRAVAGADDGWLASVISDLEAIPDLLVRLAVRADPTWTCRDGRILIPCRQHTGQDADRAPQEVSVRDSPAVRAVLDRAHAPVPVTTLTSELAARFPESPPGAAFKLVTELVRCGILLSSLRAPMTVTDSLTHLNQQLDAASADSIQAAASTAAALRQIADHLAQHAEAPCAADRGRIRAAASERMRALSAVSTRPVTTDLRLGWTAELPQNVAREAARAAEALTRLSAHPDGPGPWRDYHARFLTRYGVGAIVRVTDLTDPCTGLGLPAGYRGGPPGTGKPALTSRDEIMLALAQQAALDRAVEVNLSSEQVSSLAVPGLLTEPPHLDLCFQIHAQTSQAISEGRFSLAVMSLTPVGGAMSGRFLHLLDAVDRDRMTAGYAALPTVDPSAVHVQVSSPPLLPRAENVSRAPAAWPGVISLAEHPVGQVINLSELAVTADDWHLYLISLADGRRVEPVMLNSVEAAQFTHPIARFLCEVSRARVAVPGPFPWGPARQLPYLPRVRLGRAILAPAAWRISSTDLPPPDGSSQRWADALNTRREQLSIPAAVYAGKGDQQLRLDLDQPAHVQLLQASQKPGQPIVLREAAGPDALGWLGGRAHEITLTLAATRSAPTAKDLTVPRPPRPTSQDHVSFPGGGPCAVATLHGHTPTIAMRLPELIAACENPPRWWFTRPGPPEHLRLWLAVGEPTTFADLAGNLAAWAQQLRQLGLLGEIRWETDYPTAERLSTDAAVTESMLAADSGAAVTLLTWSASGGPRVQALTVASVLDLVISYTGSLTAGLEWIIDRLVPGYQAPRPPRALRDQVVRLASPHGDFAALAGQPASQAVLDAWATRCAAVTRYAAQVSADGQQSPDNALLTLIRGHHQRMHGPDRASEQLALRLVRSTALATLAQAPAPA